MHNNRNIEKFYWLHEFFKCFSHFPQQPYKLAVVITILQIGTWRLVQRVKWGSPRSHKQWPTEPGPDLRPVLPISVGRLISTKKKERKKENKPEKGIQKGRQKRRKKKEAEIQVSESLWTGWMTLERPPNTLFYFLLGFPGSQYKTGA